MTEKEYIRAVLQTDYISMKVKGCTLADDKNNLIQRSALNGDYSISVNDFKYDDKDDKKDKSDKE